MVLGARLLAWCLGDAQVLGGGRGGKRESLCVCARAECCCLSLISTRDLLPPFPLPPSFVSVADAARDGESAVKAVELDQETRAWVEDCFNNPIPTWRHRLWKVWSGRGA